MKLLIICLIFAWVWRIGFLVTKTRITFMRVFPNAVSWACVLCPITVAYWSFTASSTATADWLQKRLPGNDEGQYAAARKFGREVGHPPDELSADDALETIIEEGTAEVLEVLPDEKERTLFVMIWGDPAWIVTADEINNIFSVAETDDRENGQDPCPDVLAKINLEFNQEFLEAII